MRNIIYLYKQLILSRISPEALPYSPRLLWGLILGYFLINVVIFLSVEKFSALYVILAHAGYIFLTIAFVYSLLKTRKMDVRLHKILLALFGVDVFFLLCSIVLQPLNNINIQLMIAFVFMLWALSIKTHIFSKGLEVKKLAAILIVINFEIVRHIPILFLIYHYLPKPTA